MRLKISIGLTLLAIALGAVGLFFWQQNSWSEGDIKLEIVAPEKATMADEITYLVKWKNNGEAQLQNVTLVFEYPEGAVPSDDEDLRITKSIEDINPGQEGTMKFVARLFGKENDTKEAKAYLTYTPRNLSANFRSETTATTIISSVPLTFELDVPSKNEAGQQFDLVLNYFSNSSYPLSNLRIKLDYPDGFVFQGASPAPIGDNEWDIGVLNKAEGGRITIHGSLDGDVQDVKVFNATLGSWKNGEFTLMEEAAKGVQITKPQLLISQVVNSAPGYVASPGDVLHYEIFFRNPTDRVLENLFLIVTLDGRAFDLGSVKINSGKFQKGDNSIVWESKDVPKLRFLGRGEEGKVEFWVNVQSDMQTFSPQDKNLTLHDQVLLSEAKEDFELKLNTNLSVDQKGFFQDEVFGNQGPVPPKVDQKTTYTVTWTVKNVYNDVQNAKVKATLPSGVDLTGNIFPNDTILTLDSLSREIVWEVGDLPAGTGAFDDLPPKSISFQIAFTPSSSQRGQKANIIGEARVTGEDLFTEQLVSFTDDAIDTSLPDDPSVSESQGIVQ